MRAFIALSLPERLADDVADAARVLAGRVAGRFAPRENHHVTLAFLGEIGEADARAAIDALDEVAQRCLAPILVPTGLGSFGCGRDATLWMGLEPTPALTRLAEEVRSELGKRSIAYDPKPFRPHITLARRARLEGADLAGMPFPAPERARCLTLFKSTLGPEGARYKELYTVELDLPDAAEAPGRS